MAPLYTPKQAAAQLGISVSAVRLYTNTYTKYLSTEATGNPRRLTEEDLRLTAYVVRKTSTGQPHERVLAHLNTVKADKSMRRLNGKHRKTNRRPIQPLCPLLHYRLHRHS
jgi:DNA-binding transcriptional MerR regulator